MADIGERRAAEQALAESEERFRTLASRLAGRHLRHRRGRPAGLRQRAPARDLRPARRGPRRRARGSSASPAEDRERLVGEFRRARALGAPHLARRARRGRHRPLGAHSHGAGLDGARRPGLVGTVEDVTVEVTARMALAAREAEYRMLAEHSTDFLSRHALDGTFLYASPGGRAVLGWELRRDARPDAHAARTSTTPRTPRSSSATGSRRCATDRPRTAAYRARRRDGSIVWLETTFRAVRAPGGEALEMVCVSRDISERKSAELELAHRALHDGLTGLPNRTLFLDRLGQALRALAPARARRGRRLPRPRPLQGRQRLAGPQGRRPPARRRGHAAELGPAPVGHARALRRRRADAAVRGHRRRRRRARDRPAPARRPSPSPSSCRTARPSCRRASASRSRATASRRPRTSSATPTPRCTAPRPAARASRSSTRPCARTSTTASRWRPRCAAASAAASCACTASRWSRWPTRASRASRRSCAGSTPSAASCRPGRSSRWPRRPG